MEQIHKLCYSLECRQISSKAAGILTNTETLKKKKKQKIYGDAAAE
jgi:hypothetical protein